MTTVEQRRYEAVFRAVGRRVLASYLACIGTTLVLTVGYLLTVGFWVGLTPGSWPSTLRWAAIVLPFLAAIIVIPTAVQLLLVRGRVGQAIETWNVFALSETVAYTAATGRRPPTLRNAKAARAWLNRGEGHGTRMRVRCLLWVGAVDAAAEVTAHLPDESPADAFHASLLRELVEYCATGTMSLSSPRAALARIPPGADSRAAIAGLALEESRLQLDHTGDWVGPMADARAAVAPLPNGASIGSRILASLPSTLGFMALVVAFTLVTRF
jgi:hypothetical protein